jgi:hypothetical protein
LVWDIQPQDEAALDRYEGFPFLYRKEMMTVAINGRPLDAMVYIMNKTGRPIGTPSEYYYGVIMTGYRAAGFRTGTLVDAVLRSDLAQATMQKKQKMARQDS